MFDVKGYVVFNGDYDSYRDVKDYLMEMFYVDPTGEKGKYNLFCRGSSSYDEQQLRKILYRYKDNIKDFLIEGFESEEEELWKITKRDDEFILLYGFITFKKVEW